MDIKDTPDDLMKSVLDIMKTNQDLYQQDLENKYGYKPEPQEQESTPSGDE